MNKVFSSRALHSVLYACECECECGVEMCVFQQLVAIWLFREYFVRIKRHSEPEIEKERQSVGWMDERRERKGEDVKTYSAYCMFHTNTHAHKSGKYKRNNESKCVRLSHRACDCNSGWTYTKRRRRAHKHTERHSNDSGQQRRRRRTIKLKSVAQSVEYT